MFRSVIIVGGGFAGLLSARVLAPYCEQVQVIDRDTLPEQPQLRNGTPQGNHLHTLLPGGLEILEQLFPGLSADLDSLGGHAAGPSQWYALTPLGKTFRISRFQASPQANSAPLRVQTRALLEHCIRQRVMALPNVNIRDCCTITTLAAAQGRIHGVEDDTGELLPADLVVDASGRVSRTLRWLQQLGFPQPTASTVNCDFAYTSCFFRPHTGVEFDDVGFLISSARKGPYVKRGGSLAKVEHERWLVTLAGRLGDHPPKDLRGFHAYVDTLHHPKISDLLKHAEPAGEPHQYKFPQSVWRHYEKLDQFPEGLIPFGDALMHVNPGYAQGMASACRQAWALDQVLGDLRGCNNPQQKLWQNFFPLAAEQIRAPWLFAALSDFGKKGTTGDFPHHEEAAITRLKELNRRADKGDAAAADLVDAVFDLRRPLRSLLTTQI